MEEKGAEEQASSNDFQAEETGRKGSKFRGSMTKEKGWEQKDPFEDEEEGDVKYDLFLIR